MNKIKENMMARPKHPDRGVEKHISIVEAAKWMVVYSEQKQEYYLTCQVGDPKSPCLTIKYHSTPMTAVYVQDFIQRIHKQQMKHKSFP